MKLARLVICFALALITAVASAQTDTAFTYQGELNENGTPANGAYAMAFTLFDDAVGGIRIGITAVHAGVPVVDGKFAVILNFGGVAFEDNRWLEIEINGVPLTPRTPITHAPYSIQTRGIFVDGWGNVGIGTSSPEQKLSVHNDEEGTSYIQVSDFTSGTTSGLRVGMSGSGNAYIINDEPLNLSLGTSGTSHVRINDVGHMGINQLIPNMMLHIKQDIVNRGIRIEHQSNSNCWDTGVGLNSNNYKFIYNDFIRADISSVDGAYTQISDRRLKQDIQEMPAVLDKVSLLKPASYLYLDNTGGGPRSIGFIAQDVEPLFPNLVRETDEGTKGLVYDGFAVISIKAIQELDTKVNQLEAENDELRTRLGTLEQLVEQLALTQQENTK